MSGPSNPNQQHLFPTGQTLGQYSNYPPSSIATVTSSSTNYGGPPSRSSPGTYVPPPTLAPGLMTQPRPPQSVSSGLLPSSSTTVSNYNAPHNYHSSSYEPTNNLMSANALPSKHLNYLSSNAAAGEPISNNFAGPQPLKNISLSAQNGPYSTSSNIPQSHMTNVQQGVNGQSQILNTGVVPNGPSNNGSSNGSILQTSQSAMSMPPHWHSQQPTQYQPGPPNQQKQQFPFSVPSTKAQILPGQENMFAGKQPTQMQTSVGYLVPPTVPSSGISNANSLLPPPYSGQKPPTTSVSPVDTPGTSQPPSARSSRNPSPIPTQRYDFMEGQFPSNKPSPSSSSNNLQSTGQNQPQGIMPAMPPTTNLTGFPQQRPAVMSTPMSVPQVRPTSINSMSHPSFPAVPPLSSQAPVAGTSVAAPLMSQPPPVGTSTSSHIRPRYPQQVGYSQSGPVTSQPSSLSQPMANKIPQYPGNSVMPEGPVGGVAGYDPQMHAKMAGMSINSSFSRLWGNEGVNLLQDRNILPPVPVEPPKPVVAEDKSNCNPEIFRCTLNKIPESNSLLQKSRLPFGILIHPFRDVSHLPVVQCTTIVRCRNCRTYINPFVSFVDQRRWKCNLCFRVNDLPEEFLYDPVSRSYGDPARRPEVRSGTIEFIAPSDYMLRPPQPAVYLFVLDVSHGASDIGYLSSFCKILLSELDNLPGDARTQVGFITFDGSVHFYNLGEGLNQPHMLIVSDIEDIFVPSPDNLLVNLHECKALIKDLLTDLPKRFSSNGDTNSALGAALQAAYKLVWQTGGRVTVMLSSMPNIGPGALKTREDPNQRASKEVSNLGPVSDFYKKLALDCSGQQVAIDLFLLCTQYVDIATISCISKFSAGCIHYYPGFHMQRSPAQVEKFENDFKRYLTRKIGFEAVMRIRCTRGLSIHTFHGNFFVRSTDLLSLPNVNPDSGFAMQIAIEDNLTETNMVCFQAAVLYTSSKGERRIRVHSLALPVVSLMNDVLGGADQQAIVGLVSKMAVDRSLTSSLSDARDALINVCLDLLGTFKQTLPSSQTASALMAPFSARLIPLYILALLKHVAFRVGVSTKLDERVYAMEQMKTVPLSYLITNIYPNLYPVHALDDKNAIHQDDDVIVPQPPILQLSFEKIDRHGAYLLDAMDILYLYIGRAISDHFCVNVLGVPNFSAIPDHLTQLPPLNTPESERIRNFIDWVSSSRPFHAPIMVIREDSKDRYLFIQYMLDDRTESLFSYYEFLQHLRQQISK